MTEDINIDSCNMPLHQVVVSPITGLLEKIPQEDNKVNTLSFKFCYHSPWFHFRIFYIVICSVNRGGWCVTYIGKIQKLRSLEYSVGIKFHKID